MEIKGTVVNKIFESADGYAVVEIEGDEPTVVVGNMPYIKTGELTRFFGEFKTHPKFGLQFACTSYESIEPAEPDDMVLFLKSDFVKGLGEVLAGRLVETFGKDTFDVIENHPDRLTSVQGISRKLAKSLHETFVKYADSKNRYAELMGLGLTTRQAAQAAESLGGDGAARIREDPYVLIGAVKGIDFQTADKIAEKMGLEPDSPMRIERAVVHTMRKSQQDRGDMCVPRDMLVSTVSKRLQVDADLVGTAVMELCSRREIALLTVNGTVFAALGTAYAAERESAARLTEIADARVEDMEKEPPHLDRIAAERDLSDEQLAAVQAAWENPVCVITGGPGTGKTTIVRAALQMFGSAGLKCALAAPTGRAAKRMQEATGEDASTIHRLLEYTFDEETHDGQFRINEDNPLDADVVIVDEMSMVDAFLFRSLLRGIEPGTRLVMIGDANQLPSVGPGNVLSDLIMSGTLPTFLLTRIYRNSGRIAQGAHQILSGRMPEFDADEFVFLDCVGMDNVSGEVQRAYEEALSSGQDVQVIAPIKKTAIGSVQLNNTLRERVNPASEDKPEIVRGEHVYRTGDRVMQIVNDYSRKWENHEAGEKGEGVYNGDIGMIESIVGGEVRVVFEDGRTAVYAADQVDALDGAFAYTIHKAQGSEFDLIILPMHYGQFDFLSRPLLYTAVTRAKKKVIVIGSRACFEAMVRNNKMRSRWTMLAQELRILKDILNSGEGYIPWND